MLPSCFFAGGTSRVRAVSFRMLSFAALAGIVASLIAPPAAFARPTGSPPWRGDGLIEASKACGGKSNVVQSDSITQTNRRDGEAYYVTSSNRDFNTPRVSGSFYCYDEAIAAGWVRRDAADNAPPVRAALPAPNDTFATEQAACNAYYAPGSADAEVVRLDSLDMSSSSPLYVAGQTVYLPAAYASLAQGTPYYCRGVLGANAARNNQPAPVSIAALVAAHRAAQGGHSQFGAAGAAGSSDLATAAGYCMRYYPGQDFGNSVVGLVRTGVYVTSYGRSAEYFKHGSTVFMCAQEVQNWTDVDSAGGIVYAPVVAKSQLQNAKDACASGMVVLVLDGVSRDSQTLYGQPLTVFVREPSGSTAEPGWENPPRSGNYACRSNDLARLRAPGAPATIFNGGWADYGELQAALNERLVAARAAEAARQAAAEEAARQAAAAAAARQVATVAAAAAASARTSAAAIEAARIAALPKIAIHSCPGVVAAAGAVAFATKTDVWYCSAKDVHYVTNQQSRVTGVQAGSFLFPLITNDGGTLITNDGGSLRAANGAAILLRAPGGASSLIAAGNAAVISNDGATVVTHDGGSVITHDGGSVIGHDGASVVGTDGASFVAASILSSNGNLLRANALASMIAAGGGVISNDGATLVAANGSGLFSNIGGTAMQLDLASFKLKADSMIASHGAGLIGESGSTFGATGSGGFKQNSTTSAMSNAVTATLYPPSQYLAAMRACGDITGNTLNAVQSWNTVFAIPATSTFVRAPSDADALLRMLTTPNVALACRSQLGDWQQYAGTWPPPAPAAAVTAVSLAGTWKWTCCEAKFTGNWTVRDLGNGRFSGEFVSGSVGTFTGSVTGKTATFTRTFVNAGKTGSQMWTAGLSANGRSMTGTWTDGANHGTFNADKITP